MPTVNSANSQYQDMFFKVQAMIARIEDALTAHAAEQENNKLDYGFVGDMGLAESYLRQTLEVFVGEGGV